MTGIKRYQLIAFLTLGIIFVLSQSAGANQEDRSVAVQLNPIAVTAITENGYKGRSVVTPYLKVIDAEALARLCSRLPRLTEVMLMAFNETPAQLSDLKSQIEGRQDEFKTRIESVIGTGVFRGFYIVSGAIKRGEGTERVSVDGGTQACQPLKEFPWEVTVAEKSAELTSAEEATAFLEKSPLSEEQLAAVEAELLAEQPPRKGFPAEPARPHSKTPSWQLIGIVLFGLSGIMILAGSYIGYQVSKIRRERRRSDRRKSRKERRTRGDRRRQQVDIPEGSDKRKGGDRRTKPDRRVAKDRRAKNDRRDRD